MLFNSFEYLLFLPLVALIYFLLPHRFRWFHLLVASCVFYMYFIPVYILILFLIIGIDYIAGRFMETAIGRRRKWVLAMSIIANIGVLAVFKYYNFFAGNLNALAGNVNIPLLHILLPIGLSFHTFQAMSYTIEVYRGNQKAERHLGIYALYVLFFPQLVAGPIERPQNLLHQFHERHPLAYDNIAKGVRLILWGLIKKSVIADRLGMVVDAYYKHPQGNSGTSLVIATILFSFQIFCDFSGYSDMAIGSARIFGFKLMTNFNKPYHSRSVAEFWKRWHISLSTWFRDYLYISIGGNRVSVPRMYFNLLFVFLVSGFWHGANWTFIIWGTIHGLYVILGLMTAGVRNKISAASSLSKIYWLNNMLNVLATFALVSFAWIFFRANNITDAFFIVHKIAAVPEELYTVLKTGQTAFLHLPQQHLLGSCFALILFLELAHIIQTRYRLEETFDSRPVYLRWSLYYSGLLMLLYFGVYEQQQFIYFQF